MVVVEVPDVADNSSKKAADEVDDDANGGD